MAEKMKAIVWDGTDYPGNLSFRQWDVPQPPPGWVLVNTKAAGICGSDLHYLLGITRHLIPDRNLPAILGHENAGLVVNTGEGVTTVKPGDRVAIEPLLGCMQFGGSCPMCRIGKYQLCQSGLTHVGLPLVRMLPGGYGEYSIVHETRLFHIPDHVSLEAAALLDILACDVHAVNLARPYLGTTAVVLGCGIIGLDLIPCLLAQGVRNIIAVAKYEFQADMAKQFGARETIVLHPGVDPVREVLRLTGIGADQVYECVGGETDALDQAVGMARPGGVAVMLGVFSGRRPIDLLTQLLKEVNILASNSYSTAPSGEREFQISMDMLRDGLVDHERLITHRFAPEQYCEAIESAIHKGRLHGIKSMFIRE